MRYKSYLVAGTAVLILLSGCSPPKEPTVTETVTVTAEPLPPEVIVERVEVEVPAELDQSCYDLVTEVKSLSERDGDVSQAAGFISTAADNAQKYSVAGWHEKMVENIVILRDQKILLDDAVVARAQTAQRVQMLLEMCEAKSR